MYYLLSHALGPDTWTSADAGGLARPGEFAVGAIRHARRLTARTTQTKHIWPARREASLNTSPNVPPRGQRLRLKASFNVSGYSPQTRVSVAARKTYATVFAHNGGDWFITGKPDAG